MSCRDIIEFLMDYENRELPIAQRLLFEIHLRLCPQCRDYLDSYRKTVRLGQAAAAEDEPTMPEDLVRAILASREGIVPLPRS